MSKTEILNSRKVKGSKNIALLNNLLIPNYKEIKNAKSFKLSQKGTAKAYIFAGENNCILGQSYNKYEPDAVFQIYIIINMALALLVFK